MQERQVTLGTSMVGRTVRGEPMQVHAVIPEDAVLVDRARFERMRAYLVAHQHHIDEHEADPPGEPTASWRDRMMAAMAGEQDAWERLEPGDREPLP